MHGRALWQAGAASVAREVLGRRVERLQSVAAFAARLLRRPQRLRDRRSPTLLAAERVADLVD